MEKVLAIKTTELSNQFYIPRNVDDKFRLKDVFSFEFK